MLKRLCHGSDLHWRILQLVWFRVTSGQLSAHFEDRGFSSKILEASASFGHGKAAT